MEVDVTGREAILEAAIGIISQADADRIADAIYALGYVCVPREPTQQMLHEAWAYELAEDARGVWREMIDTAEGVTAVETSGQKA